MSEEMIEMEEGEKEIPLVKPKKAKKKKATKKKAKKKVTKKPLF